MKNEASILHSILLHCGRGISRLFRNNVGIAKYPDGSTVVYGLCKGSSDLIGWRQIKIEPWMVGRTVAVFTAIEVKKPGSYPTPEQKNFIAQVQASGGIAGVARSASEAEMMLQSLDWLVAREQQPASRNGNEPPTAHGITPAH